MKIVCDACDTKYSIGDDKVAGKVFKIRCKKCSHIIIVRGVVAPAEPAVEASVVVGDDWHVVVDGQQLGPFDSAEVSRRRAAGELADDTFLWREGMSDWAMLGSIDALRKPERVVDAAPPSEPALEATRLRGERNESSVLFTLGNLAKLAAPQPAATSTSTTSTAAPIEGSGLIDIRALASTLAAPAGKPASTTGSMADLPVYTPSGFADPIVLVPAASRRGPSRLVIALVALAAMLVIVTSVLVVVLIKSDDHAKSPTQVAAVTVPHGPTDIVTEPAAPPTTPTPPPAIPTPPPPAPAASPPPPAAVPASPSRRTATSSRRASSSTPPVVPSQRPGETENQCTVISCEVSNFAEKCCEKLKPAPATSSANSSLPESLDRNLLKAGIATIDVKGCSGKSSGDVSVSIKVSTAGVVTKVTIKSSPDAAASACVTAAAQKGTFAKTQRGGSFAYVWRL